MPIDPDVEVRCMNCSWHGVAKDMSKQIEEILCELSGELIGQCPECKGICTYDIDI